MKNEKGLTGRMGVLFLKSIAAILIIFSLSAGYSWWDLHQGKKMVEKACALAPKGTPIDELLPILKTEGYRFSEHTGQDGASILVHAKEGFGRYSCSIEHDGRKVLKSGVIFLD